MAAAWWYRASRGRGQTSLCPGRRSMPRACRYRPWVEPLESRNLLSNQSPASAILRPDTFADNDDGNVGPGQFSLREAILQANSDGLDNTILLAPGSYALSLAGAGEDGGHTGDLDLAGTGHTLNLQGAGAGLTTLDAKGIDRALQIFAPLTVVISGVTITGGYVDDLGGGIDNAANLTLTDSQVTFNQAAGLTRNAFGGGIYNTGSLTLQRSTVSNDQAGFSGSFTGQGGGIGNAGGLNLIDSTLANNRADDVGGGIVNYSAVTLVNSTVTANSTNNVGGGIANEGALGIAMTNTLVAGNQGGDFVQDDLSGSVDPSSSYNLVGAGDNETGIADGTNSNRVGTSGKPIDPVLGPLQDNGAGIPTCALLSGSPAIDAGTSSGAPALDERGLPRFGPVDLGAYENNPYAVTNTNDSGPGSLRDAILNSNASFGGNTIVFAIGPRGSVQTIVPGTVGPSTGLPVLTRPVTLDGWSQGGPGYTGPPLIDIDGRLAFTPSFGSFGFNIQASNVVVRGFAINNFPNVNGNGFGIGVFSGTGAWIYGNYIGTDPTGLTGVPNGQGGIWLAGSATGVRLGTNGDGFNDASERNVISSNNGDGILVQAPNTTIAGNYIGLGADGTTVLGNGGNGIEVRTGGNTLGNTPPGPSIGGTTAGGNVISGNGGSGILLGSGATGNLIAGNSIGINASGAAAAGNGGPGISAIGAESANTIGGLTPPLRNVISGNGGGGISLGAGPGSGDLIAGNYIGTDATCTAALGNASFGISVAEGVSGTTIGGVVPGTANVISGNVGYGVFLGGRTTTGNVVEGNLIGTGRTGGANLGNRLDGVRIQAGGPSTATAAVSGNAIAFNGGAGIAVLTGTGNLLQQNTIFGNAGRGIDLNADGGTANDPADADGGPNNLQNFPDLTQASLNGAQLDVTFRVDSDPANSAYPLTVEFFRSDGTGQGALFLGSVTYTAAEAQTAQAVTLDGRALTAADRIVATATDSNGNTSEFSAPYFEVNVAPVLTLSGASVDYTENNPPTPLDPAATAADADGADFDQGALTVDFASGGAAEDRLGVAGQGSGLGQVGVSGNAIARNGSAIGTFSGGSDGFTPLVITFTANAGLSDVQAVLEDVTYFNVSESPSTVSRTVRFVLTDGDGGTSNTVLESVNVTSVNDPPVLGGAIAGQTVNDNASIAPFATFTVSDVDTSPQTLAVTVTLSNSANGNFSVLNGFANAGGGVYTFVGTAAAAQATIRGLVFTPTANQVPPGATVTTGFTVSADDGMAQATDANTTVAALSVNDAPVLDGAASGQAVHDNASIAPFRTFIVADPDAGQSLAVTVRLSNAANGAFTTLRGFTDAGGGVYTFSGAAPAAQAALRGLMFTPTANQVAPGSTVTTVFTVTADDGMATATDANTSVVALSVNDAPVLGGADSAQAVNDNATVAPFTGFMVSDADNPVQVLAVMVQVSDPSDGAFTALNGFTDRGDGAYTFSGTAAVAQAALRGLVFTPTANQVAPGATVTTTFTVSANDGSALTTDANTSVVARSVNDSPVLGGAAAGQAVHDNALIAPFRTFTVTDSDAGQSLAVTVRLNNVANGAFTTLSGFTDAGSGLYTFGGTAAAAQAALRRLVFTPTPNQVPPGATVTSTFIVTADDGTAAATDTSTSVVALSINDAPVLATNLTPFLAPAAEDDPSNRGTLVANLIDSVAPLSLITDPDSGPMQGLAVVGVDNRNGTWEFSTDAGQTWTPFGSPSDGAARLLAADAVTRVRFVPAANFFGTVTGGLTFRAWDRTTGADGDTTDASNNGGTTPFSAAVATASVTVTPPPATSFRVTGAANPFSGTPFSFVADGQGGQGGQASATGAVAVRSVSPPPPVTPRAAPVVIVGPESILAVARAVIDTLEGKTVVGAGETQSLLAAFTPFVEAVNGDSSAGSLTPESLLAAATTFVQAQGDESGLAQAAPDSFLGVGATFTGGGVFTDRGGSGIVSAVVNYGDTSGDQPLALRPDNTFDLRHVYTAEGTYVITVTVTDSVTGSGTAGFFVHVFVNVPSQATSGVALPGHTVNASVPGALVTLEHAAAAAGNALILIALLPSSTVDDSAPLVDPVTGATLVSGLLTQIVTTYDIRAINVRDEDRATILFAVSSPTGAVPRLSLYDPATKRLVPVQGSRFAAGSLVAERMAGTDLYLIKLVLDRSSFPALTALRGSIFATSVPATAAPAPVTTTPITAVVSNGPAGSGATLSFTFERSGFVSGSQRTVVSAPSQAGLLDDGPGGEPPPSDGTLVRAVLAATHSSFWERLPDQPVAGGAAPAAEPAPGPEEFEGAALSDALSWVFARAGAAGEPSSMWLLPTGPAAGTEAPASPLPPRSAESRPAGIGARGAEDRAPGTPATDRHASADSASRRGGHLLSLFFVLGWGALWLMQHLTAHGRAPGTGRTPGRAGKEAQGARPWLAQIHAARARNPRSFTFRRTGHDRSR